MKSPNGRQFNRKSSAAAPVRVSGSGRKARARSEKAAVLGAALTLANAIRRGKTETVERLLARDFTFIDAAGQVHSRRDVLRNLQAAPPAGDTRETVRTYVPAMTT